MQLHFSSHSCHHWTFVGLRDARAFPVLSQTAHGDVASMTRAMLGVVAGANVYSPYYHNDYKTHVQRLCDALQAISTTSLEVSDSGSAVYG